jgi:hypothetical protein
MFVIVALPVQLIVFAPGPKYSIIAFVPPETLSFDERYNIMSLGEAQPFNFPVRKTPIRFG